MKAHNIFLTILIVSLLLTTPSLFSGRGDYETPSYKVVKSDGAFEIRDYPAMMVVSAPMESKDAKGNSAFMQLFGYISGKNEADQKIAMTSPVFSGTQDANAEMSFIIPSEVVDSGAPEATNAEINITERPAGRFAVYRYSGRWTEENFNTVRGKLLEWVKEQNLTVTGSLEKAGYDPPFTPPPLRRNEVLVPVGK